MRVIPAAFTLSILINSALLFSVDHAVRVGQIELVKELQATKKQEAKDLQFEFVEAPPSARSEKPKSTRKISDRNTLNQDLAQDKSKAGTLPQTKVVGTAGQLGQIQGTGSQPAARSQQPIEKKQEVIEKKQENEKKSGSPHETTELLPPQTQAQNVAASAGQAPIQGLTGQNRITTQEMTRTASMGAKFYGLTSFEATGSGMGEYMKKLKEKIWLAWFPYLAFKYPQDFKSADAVVSFTLNKDGQIKIVKILESSGSPLFAAFCVESVQRAGEFGKLPEEILALTSKDGLEIRFAFHYR